MNPHPHAEVLRAIADGVPLSEFEVKQTTDESGYWNELQFASIIKNPDLWEVRRKPQNIVVNGFKVPKPLDWCGNLMSVYVPRPDNYRYFDSYNESGCKRVMQLGIAHATKEAAIAHAKAMLGIDPEYFK